MDADKDNRPYRSHSALQEVPESRKVPLARMALSGVSIIATGLTSLMLPLGVQISEGTAGLGRFTLVYAPLALGLTVQRLILGQTVSRGIAPGTVRGLKAHLALLGSVVLAVTVLLSLVVGPAAWLSMIAAAVPLVLFQDFCRLALISRNLGRIAIASDLIWLSGVILGFILLNMSVVGVSGFVAIYLASVLISALVCVPRMLSFPNSGHKEHPPIAALTAEAVSISVLNQMSQYLVAFLIGVETLGDYRSVMLLFTPVTMLASLVQLAVFPKMDVGNRSHVIRTSLMWGCVAISVGLTVTIVRMIDPLGAFDRLGFVGGSVFFWTAIAVAVSSFFSLSLFVYMVRARIVLRPRMWLRIRLMASLTDPFVSTGSAFEVGAPGLVFGGIVANILTFGLVGFGEHRRGVGIVADRATRFPVSALKEEV